MAAGTLAVQAHQRLAKHRQDNIFGINNLGEKMKKLLLVCTLIPAFNNAGLIDTELALKDMPKELITAYTEQQEAVKKYIRALCLFLYNARNGIAYRDYSRKEQKYGREEKHDLFLDVSLAAQENAHQEDLDNASEYFAQIPKQETDYVSWSKDYAADFKDSAMIIRKIADELDWDPTTTKSVIQSFWAMQRKLQKSRKSDEKTNNGKANGKDKK